MAGDISSEAVTHCIALANHASSCIVWTRGVVGFCASPSLWNVMVLSTKKWCSTTSARFSSLTHRWWVLSLDTNPMRTMKTAMLSAAREIRCTSHPETHNDSMHGPSPEYVGLTTRTMFHVSPGMKFVSLLLAQVLTVSAALVAACCLRFMFAICPLRWFHSLNDSLKMFHLRTQI